MEEYVGKICPFCKTEISENDTVKICPSCNIPHHEGCWEENKGCTTFGCAEQCYEEQHTNPTDVCKSCGTPLGDGQLFCPKCGTKKEEPCENVCDKCGAQLQEGQEFCPKCGQKVGLKIDSNVNAAIAEFNSGLEKKKQKTKTLPIILVVVLLVVGIGGFTIFSAIQKRNKELAIERYITTANSFYSECLSAGSKLETVGNEIQSNWRTYIYDNGYYYKKFDSIEDAVYSALRSQSSNVTAIESSKTSIDSMYTDLLNVPEDTDLNDVKYAVQNVYDAFEDLYDCVIDVEGNYNQYTSLFSRCDSDLAKALSKLEGLL